MASSKHASITPETKFCRHKWSNVNRLIAQLPWLLVSPHIKMWASGHHHPKQLPIVGEHQPVNVSLQFPAYSIWFSDSNHIKSSLSLFLSLSQFFSYFRKPLWFTKQHPVTSRPLSSKLHRTPPNGVPKPAENPAAQATEIISRRAACGAGVDRVKTHHGNQQTWGSIRIV